MTRLRTALVASLGFLVVGTVGLWLMRGQLAVAIFHPGDRAQHGRRTPWAKLPDGLHVGLCGAGSPMPDPWTRAGPCVLVIAGKQLFLVVDSAARDRPRTWR